MAFGLLGALALEDNGLELFEDNELFVSVIDLGIALLFADEKACFLEAFQLALDIAGIFFDELGQATDMRLEIRVFGIDHDDLAADS